MSVDVAAAVDSRAYALLLHPHPDYGGNRFHPFIDGLFRRLAAAGISAIRFDFSSALARSATDQTQQAIEKAAGRWPGVPVIVVGYSFGAGIAAAIDDDRVAGWYLVAPQVEALARATIGQDFRPKAIAVPEHDQFSPPSRVEPAVAGWRSTTVTVIPDTDHFLGQVEPVVTAALAWIESVVA
jgi:alpha/beta superfamily hydrolase